MRRRPQQRTFFCCLNFVSTIDNMTDFPHCQTIHCGLHEVKLRSYRQNWMEEQTSTCTTLSSSVCHNKILVDNGEERGLSLFFALKKCKMSGMKNNLPFPSDEQPLFKRELKLLALLHLCNFLFLSQISQSGIILFLLE